MLLKAQMLLKSGFLLLSMAILSSCESEQVTPITEAKTIQEQRENRPIRVHYPIRNLEVGRIGQGIADVPLVGSIFRRIGEVFADFTVAASGGSKVDIEPTVLMFPELDRVDFEVIKYIALEEVYIHAESKEEGGKAPSLEFIREINVYIKMADTVDLDIKDDPLGIDSSGRAGDGRVSANRFDELFPSGEPIRILNYKKGKGLLKCESSCLQFTVERANWKRLLEQNRVFMVEVEVLVDSVPRADMKIDGGVVFSVGVDLGF